MNDIASDVANRIADELASCDVKLVASLPDNWLMGVIKAIDRDERFVHVPVNREESAIGLCSGAYMGAMGSAALMGASGFMTVIYAITKINYTYEIPLFLMLTLRGAGGDHHKHHISNGLYLRPVLDAINLPYQVIDDPGEIGLISRSYHHTRTFSRPMVVLFTRDLLRGERMKYIDAFRTLAKHRNGEIVVTSAGNSGQAWWAATRDTEATFYLDASMSLATMFSSGIALARPELKIWAFMGDGAFLHESRNADGRAPDEPAEFDAYSGVEPSLRRDVERRTAEFQGQRLSGDCAIDGIGASIRVQGYRCARSRLRRRDGRQQERAYIRRA